MSRIFEALFWSLPLAAAIYVAAGYALLLWILNGSMKAGGPGLLKAVACDWRAAVPGGLVFVITFVYLVLRRW